MPDQWLEMWNQRYRSPGYAYGKAPNEFLKAQLLQLPKGRILFPAEGEGRNAVFAAAQGWEAHAFDISEAGRQKAAALAEEQGVPLRYKVGALPELSYQEAQFDAIGLIYAHFPPPIRSAYHRLLATLLKTGGKVLLEAFSKNHLAYRAENPSVGGPPSLPALFSIEEVKQDFPNFEIDLLEEQVVSLNEGNCHVGEGSVIRFVGTKLG